jgi:hypothetical protein
MPPPAWHPELIDRQAGRDAPAVRCVQLADSALSVARQSRQSSLYRLTFQYNLALGYYLSVTEVSKAASLLGRKSAEARAKKWGKREFVRRMKEWGRLGGRPKGSGKQKGGAK